jgi:hypothetical protein
MQLYKKNNIERAKKNQLKMQGKETNKKSKE